MTTLNLSAVSLPTLSPANDAARRAPTPSLVAELDAVVVRGSYGRISTVHHVVLVEPVSGRVVWRSVQHAVGAENAAKFAARVTAALSAGEGPEGSPRWVRAAGPMSSIESAAQALADAE